MKIGVCFVHLFGVSHALTAGWLAEMLIAERLLFAKRKQVRMNFSAILTAKMLILC